MKTAVSIPDPVFIAAERAAKRMGVSRSRFYALAIEKMLKEQHARGVKEALDTVYENKASRLDRVLAALQQISLPAEEDW